jgi:hypothetical protein
VVSRTFFLARQGSEPEIFSFIFALFTSAKINEKIPCSLARLAKKQVLNTTNVLPKMRQPHRLFMSCSMLRNNQWFLDSLLNDLKPLASLANSNRQPSLSMN